MIEATCVAVQYIPGSHSTVPSFSRVKPGALKNIRKKGKRVTDRHTGWADVITGSQYLLRVLTDMGTEQSDINVGIYFKQWLGNLTPRRRTAIEATMPDHIIIEERVARNGEQYLAPREADMDAWLDRVRLYLPTKITR